MSCYLYPIWVHIELDGFPLLLLTANDGRIRNHDNKHLRQWLHNLSKHGSILGEVVTSVIYGEALNEYSSKNTHAYVITELAKLVIKIFSDINTPGHTELQLPEYLESKRKLLMELRTSGGLPLDTIVDFCDMKDLIERRFQPNYMYPIDESDDTESEDYEIY